MRSRISMKVCRFVRSWRSFCGGFVEKDKKNYSFLFSLIVPALAEAKPDDMDEIQAREFFFKNFELWVSQFDNLKTVFQKAL